MDLSLEPDFDYVTMANVAYNISFKINNMLKIPMIEWDDLDDREKYAYVVLTKYIVRKRVHEPKQVHQFWSKLFKKNGWVYNSELNQGEQYHDCINTWRRLKDNKKMQFKVFLITIRELEDLFLED